MDMNKTADRMTQKVKPAAWIAAALLSVCVSANAADSSLDRVVAVVNKEIILHSEVQQTARRLQASSKETNNSALMQQALDSLVSERLQLQAAKRAGINPKAADLDQAVNSIAARNNLNLEQFKQALKKRGIDYSNFRKTIASELIINSLKQRQSSKNNAITTQDINELITAESREITANRSYHIQDIVIPAPDAINIASYNQAKQSARKLRDLALRTPDFMKAQVSNSTAIDLGWKPAETLSFAYLTELTKLEPGQISNVIADASGFHVLKLIDQRGGANLTSQQVRVRHILIKEAPDAKAKIDALRQQLTQGADFGVIAKASSDDTGSAINNGDLGWSDSKRYVAEFSEAAETLPLNTLSPPIKTKFGYHLLEVLDRREVDASRQALETQARKLILNKKQQQDYEAWVEGLRTSAFIEYKKP